MLWDAAQNINQRDNLDFKVVIKFLCREGETCCEYAHQIGDINDYEDVVGFGSVLIKTENSVLTFEIEKCNTLALRHLSSLGINVFPGSVCLGIIQDKFKQIGCLRDYGISIPKTEFCQNHSQIQTAFVQKHESLIWKRCQDGRDGLGINRIDSVTDIVGTPLFTPGIVQPMLPIIQEISVLVARNVNQDISCSPVFETIQGKDSYRLEKLIYNANSAFNKEVYTYQNIAIKAVTALNVIGLAAVEMFVLEGGEVLVNEVSPRLHNSGHLTNTFANYSQGEMHLLAILNQPLPEWLVFEPLIIMQNIAGPDGISGNYSFVGLEDFENWMQQCGAALRYEWHDYSKGITKPG